MAKNRSFHIMLSHRERKTIMRFQKKTSSGNAEPDAPFCLQQTPAKDALRKPTAKLLLQLVPAWQQ